MKKALSIILSAVLLLAVIPIGTASVSAAEDNAIEIRTIAELYNINNNMSGNYKLMNDIDMTQDTAVGGDWDFMGNGWEPIGSNGVYGKTAFKGTFDGNGHIIIGMRINRIKTPSGAGTIYLGLFANNAGTIQNLGIDDTSVVSKGHYTAGICANNSGTLLNCYNEAEILSPSGYYSGGICAYNSGDISNCYNNADVSSSDYSGGICAYNSGDISNCFNKANVSSCKCSGGICGLSCGIGTISGCYNNGNIQLQSNNITKTSLVYGGGISGQIWSGQIINCYNLGTVSSNHRYIFEYCSDSHSLAGGITGEAQFSVTITNCYNQGNISSESLSYSTKFRSCSSSGGICGENQNEEGNIENCYNIGSITSVARAVYNYATNLVAAYTGGIAAASSGLTNSCYSVGALSASAYNEGITYCGSIHGNGGTVTNCYYLNGEGYSNTGAKALTKAQFQLEMCMPNFDFENTWVIYKETEYKYPQLRENLQEKEKHLISIDVTIPDKTSYLVGEEFDPSGMTVVGHYDDDTSKKITDYEISGFTGEVGRNNITVTVGEKSAVFYVTVHNKGEWTTVKEPTCTEKGEKKLYCTDCEALLDTEEIPAKGHTEVTDIGHEPTCTESGLTDGSHCSVCNTILTEQEVIPAKGHTPYLNWETIKNPTCIAHGEKVRYCSVCGAVAETMNIDVTDHQPVIDEAKEATCLNSGLTEGSHCSVCHTVLVTQQVIQPKGHDWDEGEIISNPTCTTTGEKLYHCKNCGQTKSETIPIRGHKPSAEWSVIKEATTTETGLEEKHCIVCGAVLESREIPIKTIILGDVNGDGHITVSDATLVQKHVAKLITLTDDALAAADTNKDGYITIADATLIQKYAAKMIDHF